MKIFLTGGQGMVGRNICAYASRFNHITVDAPTRSELNLSDMLAVKKYLERSAPDIVIHCAGLVGGIQANIVAPYDFCFQNLQIGLNIVQSSYEVGISQFINLGSSCMYPRDARNPLAESQILTAALEPTNEGYAVAKIAVAKLVEYLATQHGLSYKTLIPCNLYGVWDKFDAKKSHMIPSVIKKIHDARMSGKDCVEIWGDGTARREFMFAEDLADFIFFAITQLDKLPAYTNVGLGYDYSIDEYYSVIKEVLQYGGQFKYDLTRPIGMMQKLVDISLQTQLGWSPKTDLKTGIARTYAYFCNL